MPGRRSPRWWGSPHHRMARGRTTTANRSTSIASTTALTSSGRQSTLPGNRGSTSTAKVSWERAWTSAGIQTNPGSTSRGRTHGRTRTRGSARNRTWARSVRCTLTMDPFEKYDMTFNGAVASRLPNPSPGNYAGQDNGWVLAVIYPAVMEFNKSIVAYPNIKRSPGGPSNDWRSNLQNPDNPVSLLDIKNPPRNKGGGG